MRTETGFTAGEHIPVLICIPTHEVHVLDDHGDASTDTWAEGLPKQRFRKVADLRRLDEVGVDLDWTVQFGRPSRLATDPRFVTLTGVVRGRPTLDQGPFCSIRARSTPLRSGSPRRNSTTSW